MLERVQASGKGCSSNEWNLARVTQHWHWCTYRADGCSWGTAPVGGGGRTDWAEVRGPGTAFFWPHGCCRRDRQRIAAAYHFRRDHRPPQHRRRSVLVSRPRPDPRLRPGGREAAARSLTSHQNRKALRTPTRSGAARSVATLAVNTSQSYGSISQRAGIRKSSSDRSPVLRDRGSAACLQPHRPSRATHLMPCPQPPKLLALQRQLANQRGELYVVPGSCRHSSAERQRLSQPCGPVRRTDPRLPARGTSTGPRSAPRAAVGHSPRRQWW
ncbi:hypothetical protein Saa2_00702 [Streptomyces acidiscabies]|nr:hypothetical protein Saa2_00702 [Streptomyces acidiscabies]